MCARVRMYARVCVCACACMIAEMQYGWANRLPYHVCQQTIIRVRLAQEELHRCQQRGEADGRPPTALSIMSAKDRRENKMIVTYTTRT